MSPTSSHPIPIVMIVAMAVLLRLAAVWVLHDNLLEDRDAYRGIAESLVDGNGYSSPGTGRPTAFRPPLYPLVLAAIMSLGGGATAIGVVHAVLGSCTVWLTVLLGRRMGASSTKLYLAAGVVAFDPLLIMYTTFAMTETLFTLLVALLLFLMVMPRQDEGTSSQFNAGEETMLPQGSFVREVIVGLVFGLSALCRPTIWAFGVTLAVLWVGGIVFRGKFGELRGRVPWAAIVTGALVVAPWTIRNQFSMGRPIVTTTHGGYTLLLGNNPVFYREVVQQPPGTVWGGDSLRAWQQSLEVQMAAEDPPIVGELNRDRWMKQRARHNIASDIPSFLSACWLRLRRLWNLVPQGAAAESIPAIVRWGVGTYYAFVLFGCAWAIVRFQRADWVAWLPLVALLISFSLVHAVYWSNVRMRAPLVPAIALLCAWGWTHLAGVIWAKRR